MKSIAIARNSSEAFLRYVWQHQLFTRDAFTTTDGRPLTVFSPGVSNPDGGPDFSGARVQIGRTLFTGDVEIHRDPADWHTHLHGKDPHYNRVILHVTLTDLGRPLPALTACGRTLPQFTIEPVLHPDATAAWERHNRSAHSRSFLLPCTSWASIVPPKTLEQWLLACAHTRMERRIQLLEERLRQLLDEAGSRIGEPHASYYGNPDEIPMPSRTYSADELRDVRVWDQLLYEGVVEAMGISKNRDAFHTLAQNIPLDVVRKYHSEGNDRVCALLFGAAGLLPVARGLPDSEARRYVRRLRHEWRGIQPTLRRPVLHEGDWKFFRLRPLNFPTARLAVISFLETILFADRGGFPAVLRIFDDRRLDVHLRLRGLHDALRIHPEGFWRSHTHFRSKRPGQGIALGPARRNAAILSAILPLVFLYARLEGNALLGRRATEVFAVIPPLRHGIPREVQGRVVQEGVVVRGAMMEEGMRELYMRYCVPGRCDACRIGKKSSAKGKMKKEK